MNSHTHTHTHTRTHTHTYTHTNSLPVIPSQLLQKESSFIKKEEISLLRMDWERKKEKRNKAGSARKS
jgi:hypothetical protein